ncbi:MAG: L-threonylcarbamoyladenylate synthase [Caldilinea sp.]|nr:threonylcarbamoyl-AMP synthase [Caldilinea sp.]MCB0134746.1 threonylcarbamoyl-AMP synthase [Caldilineaceae bacterium]MCB0038121.1 threonylcarbamoyl-AMP synthase [Caldilinea sp.]MCB0049295.1 threonylcarbamoyl-AMP synthase [Caldilinea sp.]MCB0146701.1 threonylcarbamoyl-AMP synthase [Caldilineaceae bacterium]
MTETQTLHVDPSQPEPGPIAVAAAAIRAGQLVAFPTETVYGLGANALDAAAVARIFAAKQRPSTDPLIVHLADASHLERITADIPPVVERLAERFWPGPLTLVVRRGAHVAPNVSSGRDTVAVRVPAHPVAHALLAACDLPIAAPSANLFSRPSPTTAQHVLADLDGRVDIILDGGPATIGLESTVIDLTQTPPVLLRPGGVPAELLLDVLPDLRVPAAPLIAAEGEAASSPGTLLKHYAPHATVVLLRGDAAAARHVAQAIVALLHSKGLRAGLLVPDEESPLYAGLQAEVVGLGPSADLLAVARYLFARLRELDSLGVDLILAREVDAAGLGLAIRDRLFRAAEGRVLDAGAPFDLARWLATLPPGFAVANPQQECSARRRI